jgi:hypothetical protein
MREQVRQLMRLLRGVVYEVKLEAKRNKRAKVEFFTLSAIVALLLGVDYTAARIIFAYLDPTLGQTSLGPEFIALCVPIAVVAVHLLIADDGGKTIEHRLKRLAGVGVFVFLIGIAGMLALVYLDSADGVGSSSSNSAIQGTVGNQDIGISGGETSWFFAVFQGVFAGIVPVIFFFGMSLILFVTVYASHKLLSKIEERYEFFSRASPRSRELLEVFDLAEELGGELVRMEARIHRARSKLPPDPEHRFAEVASAAISKALHRMNRNLRGFDTPGGILEAVTQRKASVPPHIKSHKDGRNQIAKIRQATTPYAILIQLGGMAPKEEE